LGLLTEQYKDRGGGEAGKGSKERGTGGWEKKAGMREILGDATVKRLGPGTAPMGGVKMKAQGKKRAGKIKNGEKGGTRRCTWKIYNRAGDWDTATLAQ